MRSKITENILPDEMYILCEWAEHTEGLLYDDRKDKTNINKDIEDPPTLKNKVEIQETL